MYRVLAALSASLIVASCQEAPAPAAEVVENEGLRTNLYVRAVPTPGAAGSAPPPADAAAAAFARSFLDGLQPISIAEGVEYCGYFYITDTGQIAATKPVRGERTSCSMPGVAAGSSVFASYHTHGSAAPTYGTERPSAIDLTTDFSNGIDGYVSTPGGRVWHVDYSARQARQICGRGCVFSDPAFGPPGPSPIKTTYTLAELQASNGLPELSDLQNAQR